MKITLDMDRTIEENASQYFERSKRFRKKREGALIALENAKNKLEKLEKKQAAVEERKAAPPARKKEWYEKFRWFMSSEGFLCLGGRDATTNDILIKKHAEKDDIVFHTDMAGSPFFVIKTEGRQPGEATLRETADATLTFSKAWALGLASAEVFYVKPEQVTKEAMSGEYLKKGSFMIKGKTNYVENRINLAIGNDGEKVMAGPLEAVKMHCKDYLILEQGQEKAGAAAKRIQARIGGDLEDIIRALPSGGFSVKK